MTPLASGTVAQVHRARLHSGKDVAVKVQHEAAKAMMSGDLLQLRMLTGLLQWLHVDLCFDIRSIVLEYCARVRSHVDIVPCPNHVQNLNSVSH
jgi:predicted unusual protein kinase regulating ubiquinone biosynthesis (AarF/ABC1/UbiB family)